MELKKVITGMRLEYPDGTEKEILRWNINNYDHQTITTLGLADGTELKIVSDNVTVDASKRRDY